MSSKLTLTDATLGSVGRLLPPSPTLNHLVRYLSTWSGTDKFFMLIQYASKLIIWALQKRAGGKSVAAQRLGKLSAVVSDSRILYRLWGLLPIFQWASALERSPPPTRRLLNIERLQSWSMLLYYPLEHAYYLASHGVIPLPAQKLLQIGVWSCRFWAAYVVLQLLHLTEDRRLLSLRTNALRKSARRRRSGSNAVDTLAPADEEWADVRARAQAIATETVVNLGYLPLTIHWSLEKGLYANDVWTGVFGTIAALGQLRAGWKATALPVPTKAPEPEAPEPVRE